MTGENDSCGKASNMSPKKTANNGKRKIHILYWYLHILHTKSYFNACVHIISTHSFQVKRDLTWRPHLSVYNLVSATKLFVEFSWNFVLELLASCWPSMFHENWHSERHTLLKGKNEKLPAFSTFSTNVVNIWNRNFHKNSFESVNFTKISAVWATLFLWVYMFLHPHSPHLLFNLGEIQYKESDHNAVTHLSVSQKSVQARLNFSY